MIFADKLIILRKKKGWSQEELAERMDVSRQSVSKWESAQSMPDIDRLLDLSKIFGVSLDYLLKEDIEDESYSCDLPEDAVKNTPVRFVSLADAKEFLGLQKKNAVRFAIGVFLCIISVFPLLLLGGANSSGITWASETLVAAVGIPALLIIIAAAVALFVVSGIKGEKYEFLEKEAFRLEQSALELAQKSKDEYRVTYSTLIAIGVVLCVISPVPLFLVALNHEQDFFGTVSLCVMLFVISIAVIMFVIAGTNLSGFQKLLKEGEYAEKTPKEKKRDALFGIYWLGVTAGYLAWSFLSNAWARTWIVWPIAAVLYACINKLICYKEE